MAVGGGNGAVVIGIVDYDLENVLFLTTKKCDLGRHPQKKNLVPITSADPVGVVACICSCTGSWKRGERGWLKSLTMGITALEIHWPMNGKK